MPTIILPAAGGRLEPFATRPPRDFGKPAGKLNRVAFAAAHVVADPFADVDPWLGVAIDWETTLKFRSHLWSLGLGVAEAMDTRSAAWASTGRPRSSSSGVRWRWPRPRAGS
jgi:hypothetical protein